MKKAMTAAQKARNTRIIHLRADLGRAMQAQEDAKTALERADMQVRKVGRRLERLTGDGDWRYEVPSMRSPFDDVSYWSK